MKKLTSFWVLATAAVAVSLLLSSCITDTPNSSPVGAQGPAGASATAAGPAPASPYSGGDTADSSQINPPAGLVGSLGPATAEAAEGAPPDRNAAADYRIAPRDILQISVFQVQDLNNTVQVAEDGTVTLPLVGKVPLSGRTTYEAEQLLTVKLRRFLQSPQVSVSVKTYGKRITVSGEVKGPRVLSDDGNTTLSEAVANSGGLSDLANASRVHVARSINGRVQDQIYDLDEIQAGKTPDPLLKGGDIVVAESSQARVALKNVKDLLPFAVFSALF